MRYAVHAEWTKLRTLRSTAWLLLGLVAATVVVGVSVASAVDTSHCPTPARCFEDTTKDSLTGVRVGQIAVVLLAASMIGTEYGTGTIHTTLTAFPRRVLLLGGKASVLAGVVAAAGTVAVLGALWAGHAVLAANGFTPANGYPDPSVTDGATLRAVGGTVVYLVLVALLTFGVGAALRNTAGTTTVLLALLYIAPLLVQAVSDPDWHRRLDGITPMTAGPAVQTTRGLERLPIGPWPGMAVLGGYTATALLVGGVRFVRRDA
ncbi:ABC transporter permease [Embleya scabrispora]|uniref:ABC transporter permease n=1 Tax=Embleya scabrispora TaxID=159449 RepID=A0A1T3P4G3_9ACTN|nr:ABC transporter permease [Embleya scabrispora]OPC83989.1 ABC transporter permease [Embleya scabrispora]